MNSISADAKKLKEAHKAALGQAAETESELRRIKLELERKAVENSDVARQNRDLADRIVHLEDKLRSRVAATAAEDVFAHHAPVRNIECQKTDIADLNNLVQKYKTDLWKRKCS